MKKSSASDKSPISLLEALVSAGVNDMEAINKLADEKETELNLLVAEKHKEIDALRQLSKVLDIRINGRAVRKMGPRKKKADANGQMVEVPPKLAGLILQCIVSHGPGTVETIAQKLSVSPQAVRMSIRKSPHMFDELENGKITNR